MSVEKLNEQITKSLNEQQNDLFSKLLREHCAEGVKVTTLWTKHLILVQSGNLSKLQYKAVFDALNAILNAQYNETTQNFGSDPAQ